MASFSFGAGNAAKLMRIPFYLLGAIVTAIVPRSRESWVFGCGAGIGDGPLALWHRAAADGVPALWLTRSAEDARDADVLGIPHTSAYSVRGFWATARARVVVVSHGFGDVNRYAVSGAFVVQLWHGIPLKRIGLDSPATTRSGLLPESRAVRSLLSLLYRRTARRIRILPAASHLVRGRLETAFGLDDARVRVTGEPRVDVLSAGTADERRTRARRLLREAAGDLSAETRIVLYAPTWRDGEPDPAVPSPAEWSRIIQTLDALDAVLLVRSHPLGAGEYTPPVPTDRVRSLSSERLRDVTPVLPAVDVLVTDYSSIAFDAALVPVPVVWLAPDVEEYAASRGFYGRYADVAGSDPAASWDDALGALRATSDDPSERERRLSSARSLSAKVHAYRDGLNTERVYRVIRARTAAPSAGSPPPRRKAS